MQLLVSKSKQFSKSWINTENLLAFTKAKSHYVKITPALPLTTRESFSVNCLAFTAQGKTDATTGEALIYRRNNTHIEGNQDGFLLAASLPENNLAGYIRFTVGFYIGTTNYIVRSKDFIVSKMYQVTGTVNYNSSSGITTLACRL